MHLDLLGIPQSRRKMSKRLGGTIIGFKDKTVECCCCVFFPLILDIKFVGRTSLGHTGGRSHRIPHPPSFCGACLNFSREKDSAIPFPRRPWGRILCTHDLIVLPPLGIFVFIFIFLVRKIPFAGIELTSQRVRRLHGYLWATEAKPYHLYGSRRSRVCAARCIPVKLRPSTDKINWSDFTFHQ